MNYIMLKIMNYTSIAKNKVGAHQNYLYWLKEVFIPYQTSIAEKCLLVMDKASSHISPESI